MEQHLFNPHRMSLPKHLILIPQFWDTQYFLKLSDQAAGTLKLLESQILLFGKYSLITGFLGYPHLLTLLEFIEDVREKEIYFLGTAGSLNTEISEPQPLEVTEIHSCAILDSFCREKSFALKTFPESGLRPAKGVTVDIIQRETIPWLHEQQRRKMDFVEMEIFPLRAFLEKPIHAIVIASDIIKETGVDVFVNKKKLRHEFVKAYELIANHICH